MNMKLLWLALLLSSVLACNIGSMGGDGPNGDGDGYHTGDFFVRATVDGVAYEGNSQGTVFSEDPTTGATQLMLWPADTLQGYLFGWEGGETGSFDVTHADDMADMDGFLMYAAGGGGSWVSNSGSVEIDTWEEHTPDNGADYRIGFIGGTFEAELEDLYGADGAISIVNGEFFSMVSTTGQ